MKDKRLKKSKNILKNKKIPTRSEYKKRNNRRAGWQTILGVILIVISISLFALEPIKNMMVERGVESAQVSNFTREDILNNQQRNVTFDLDEITYINPMNVIADGVNPNDLPVIGGLAIPDLDMNLPINKGTSNAGMYYGAGTVWKGQEMGKSNYVLASHHSNQPGLLFQPLAELVNDPEYYESLKMKTYLTDLDKVYIYEIDNIFVVDPSQGQVMYPTDDPILTMITCTYDLNSRVIVQASLKDVIDIELASQEIMDAFNIDQTTL